MHSPSLLSLFFLVFFTKRIYLETLSSNETIREELKKYFNSSEDLGLNATEIRVRSSPKSIYLHERKRIAGLNISFGEKRVLQKKLRISYYNNMLNETWLDLVGVMDLFTQREYDNNSAVQALTAAYRYTVRQQKRLKTLPISLRKPFIVIEGLDELKRSELAKALAIDIEGYMVLNPPETFDVVLRNFPNNSTRLTNGFNVLCTYIAALHARYVVQKAPAILGGYWLGRAAAMIAREFGDKLPPFESKFWQWPEDLVKPNVIFYITDRLVINEFDDPTFVRRYLNVFDNWINPRCIPLVRTESIDDMMAEIDPYLEEE